MEPDATAECAHTNLTAAVIGYRNDPASYRCVRVSGVRCFDCGMPMVFAGSGADYVDLAVQPAPTPPDVFPTAIRRREEL